MEIKVLGPGCANCQTLAKRTEEATNKAGVEATVTKVSGMDEILAFGIMRTPGLVIDGKLVLSGRVPSVEELVTIIKTNRVKITSSTEVDGECSCGGKSCC